jgi:hypothetical protein|tara:strand:- start:959 stop:1063 length:105 start_codon:yes stop_codon:yes gene_type:complete
MIENKLKKIGIPAGYITLTAIIVSFLCNNLGVCD